MDGRTRAGRAPLCCVGRVPGAPAMQCKQTYFILFLEPDALSTNLFPSLFLSSLPIFFFLLSGR